jgi:hypothetical protein
MSNKSRLILILVLAVAFSALLVWMAFHPRVSARIWHNPLVITVVLILCAAPIYHLFRTLRKRTPSSAIAALLLAGALISGVVYFIGDLVLQLETTWVFVASELSKGLIVASCLLFIWNGLRRKGR